MSEIQSVDEWPVGELYPFLVADLGESRVFLRSGERYRRIATASTDESRIAYVRNDATGVVYRVGPGDEFVSTQPETRDYGFVPDGERYPGESS